MNFIRKILNLFKRKKKVKIKHTPITNQRSRTIKHKQ